MMSKGTQAKISRNAEERQSMPPIRLWNVSSFYDFVMTVESWQVQHTSNLGIHARLWRWCICWLEPSGRSGQQLNQFERQKNALTVNPARAVNRKTGHWWLKSIGNSSAKLFHGKQFHDDMIIAKDKCFNVIDPWASIYNLLIPTKAVSQNSWNSRPLIGQKRGKQASDWIWTGCSFSFSSRRSECWAHGPRPRRPARLFVRLLRPALDMQTLDMHAHTCLNIFIF